MKMRSALLACILELEDLWSKGHHLAWAIAGPLITHNVTENYTLDVSPWDFGVCYYIKADSHISQAQSGILAFKKRGKTIFMQKSINGGKDTLDTDHFLLGKATKLISVNVDTCWEHQSLIHTLAYVCIYFSLNGCWFCRVCWPSSNFQAISTSELVQALAVLHQTSSYRRREKIGPPTFCLIKILLFALFIHCLT